MKDCLSFGWLVLSGSDVEKKPGEKMNKRKPISSLGSQFDQGNFVFLDDKEFLEVTALINHSARIQFNKPIIT